VNDEKEKLWREMFRCFRVGVDCSIYLPCPMVGGNYGVDSHCAWYFLFSIGGKVMKVVVVKSPKLFKGVLKLIFGIKKEN
jgi:hypothetical protein